MTKPLWKWRNFKTTKLPALKTPPSTPAYLNAVPTACRYIVDVVSSRHKKTVEPKFPYFDSCRSLYASYACMLSWSKNMLTWWTLHLKIRSLYWVTHLKHRFSYRVTRWTRLNFEIFVVFPYLLYCKSEQGCTQQRDIFVPLVEYEAPVNHALRLT